VGSTSDWLDVARTLERIGYHGSLEPSYETLRALQRAFLLSVPFENLDIHLGREITLAPEPTYAKIVGEGRGGFCYECNGLFHDLLSRLGFRVSFHSARMALGERFGQAYGHMVLQVQLDAAYLVDVGNGQSCREPLRIDGSDESSAEGITYRVGPLDSELALWLREEGAEWRPRFRFDVLPRSRSEFADMCRYHQTSPDSLFTRGRLVTLAQVDGRLTLVGTRLITAQADTAHERELGSDEEYRACLRERFGIEIDDGSRWTA
jgi:N-hydroxyarylamine O-acetyltransferase